VISSGVRYLVLSDVHANVVALDAVLADARTRGFDEALFLGDAVGYYPFPQEVVERLRSVAPVASLLGNHDAQLIEIIDGGGDTAPRDASPVVTPVLEAQADALDAEAVAWLRALATHHVDERFEAVHGALVRPWQYLYGLPEAEENLPLLSRPLCLVGHTHVPRVLAAAAKPDGARIWRQMTFRDEGGRYRMPPRASGFFNPGAVGQPRDGIPLASYGLYDVDKGLLEVVRVAFDVVRVQREVRQAGYPDALAGRLAVGR
jgi:predicted phosphodiesterase